MAYCRECPYCGANLDPGEHCSCREEETASGYMGIGPKRGIFVKKEDAYSHALGSGVNIPEEIKECPTEVEEWYYSGNFVKV